MADRQWSSHPTARPAGMPIGLAATDPLTQVNLPAGAVAGHAARRIRAMWGSRATTTGPNSPPRFGPLHYDESLTVTTDVGLGLYVETVEPVDGVELPADLLPPLGRTAPTLVFVHGFRTDMGSFYFQREELSRLGEWRMVFYDQPGHGRSGRLARGEYTVGSLGRALRRVIAEAAPDEPVVLAGHSMGGTAILALAGLDPLLFLDRVAGVVLIATSVGRPQAVHFGLPEAVARTGRPPWVGSGGTRRAAAMLDRAQAAAGSITWQLTGRYGFGAAQPDPALLSFVEGMSARTPTDTIARYLRTLYGHTRYPSPALEALQRVPVLLVVGDNDPVAPASAALELCRSVPAADLVTVPDSGHLVQLEQAETVTGVLLQFLKRVCP